MAARLFGLAWLAWGLAAAFYAYGFFLRVAPSVLVDELMLAYDISAVGVGTLTAAYFYAYASVQIPVGVLVDRLGPRNMIISAASFAACAGVVFAQATSLDIAIVGRAGIGLATGVAYIAALKTAAQWFPPQRFGLLAGLTLAAGIAGAIGAQAPLAWLADTFGWREALFAISLVGFGVALSVFLMVPRQPPLADGFVAHQEGGAASMRRLIRDPQILLAALFTGSLGAAPLAFAGLWGVPYFVHVHALSVEMAGAATSSMLLVWAVAGPCLGWLGDRFHARRVVMIGCAFTTLAAWTIMLVTTAPPMWLAITLTLAMGMAAGGMIVAFAQAQARFGPAVAGRVAGLVNCAVLLFGALTQTAVGWRLDALWGGEMAGGVPIYDAQAYRGAFLVFVLLSGAAVFAALRLNESRKRPAVAEATAAGD